MAEKARGAEQAGESPGEGALVRLAEGLRADAEAAREELRRERATGAERERRLQAALEEAREEARSARSERDQAVQDAEHVRTSASWSERGRLIEERDAARAELEAWRSGALGPRLQSQGAGTGRRRPVAGWHEIEEGLRGFAETCIEIMMGPPLEAEAARGRERKAKVVVAWAKVLQGGAGYGPWNVAKDVDTAAKEATDATRAGDAYIVCEAEVGSGQRWYQLRDPEAGWCSRWCSDPYRCVEVWAGEGRRRRR